MKPLDSAMLLKRLGYSFERLIEPRVEPEYSSVMFNDIDERFSKTRLNSKRLYRHQLEAFNVLRDGKNLILVSGTGSGKTEAWLLYVLHRLRDGLETRVLAVYPTLALAHDQVARLMEYGEVFEFNVIALDAQERDRLEKQLGRAGLRRRINEAHIVATNPAFLLHEVKRLAEGREPLLSSFIRRPTLIVIDEFDFYGPRSIALLLATIEVITMVSESKPQVAVLTATLSNPDDLGAYLRRVTGRDYAVVSGRPFHPENRMYIVIGKDLERLRRLVIDIVESKRLSLPRELKESLYNAEKFRVNVYKLIGFLQSQGVNVPSPSIDVVEILEGYVEDRGVTLVFTRSIATAERLARRLRERLGEKARLVATHHHLVPKERRREIEEAARRGEIRIIISPRTLSQGIDIGTVVRVVHVGLPEDVREFRQREGRKGRRPEIAFTESIVLPYSPWDREIITKGVDALKEWLSMPLEKVIVNPDNLYIRLFTGLWKLIRGLQDRLDELEARVLKEAGVLTETGVNRKRLKWIWDRVNFYEFGPPYGVKRYLVHRDGREEALEPIGFCDLVEHFQVGCIDLANDAIVTGFKRGGRGLVTAVIEEPISEVDFYRHPALADAIEEYILVKRRWGEEPNIRRDISRGMVVSQAVAVVHPPKRGFGRLIKIPNRVVWVVHGEKPLVLSKGDDVIVAERRSAVYVTGETGGVYTDFTYGYVVEVPPWEDPSLLRIGLAVLTIVLRRVLGIEFETIKYSVERLADYKAIEVHEPEAAGVIEKLDWSSVADMVSKYKPSKLDLALLALVDEVAYSEFLAKNLDWNLALDYARRVALYLAAALSPRIVVEAGGVKLVLPKPGRERRIASLGVAWLSEEATGRLLVALSVYDGGDFTTSSYETLPVRGVRPPQEARVVELYVQELVDYEGFKLVVHSSDVVDALEKAGLRLLARLAREAVVAEIEWRKSGLPDYAFAPLFERFVEAAELRVRPATGLAAEAAEALQRGWRRKALSLLEEAAKAIALQAYFAVLATYAHQADVTQREQRR